MKAKNFDSDAEYQYSNSEGPVCPHCGHQFTADEGLYFDSSSYTRDECDECGQTFAVEVDHSTSWTTRKIR